MLSSGLAAVSAAVAVDRARRSASGWAQVSETFRWLASRFANGELHLEVIAAGVSGDLAYTVGYERLRASFDGGPAGPIRLRVTHIYRRENGEWKIVHRHGYPLETARIRLVNLQPQPVMINLG
jgi:ketosteroid isomerase-like protein